MIALVEKKVWEDPMALNAACNQVFILQAGLAALAIFTSIFSWSLGTHHFLVLVATGVGYLATKDYDPESWKTIAPVSLYVLSNALIGFFGFFFGLNFTFFSFAFTMVKTAATVIQSGAFFVLWRLLQRNSVNKNNYFYLNVVVTNASEVLEQKTAEKVGAGPIGRLAGKFVSKAVTDAKFCAKVTEGMIKELPEKMSAKGITAAAACVFKKANFFVMKVTIHHVDLPALIASKEAEGEMKGESKVGKVRSLLAKLPSLVREEVEYLLNVVLARGMISKMPAQMAEEMQEKAGMKVEVVANHANAQADFFFELLAHMQEEKQVQSCKAKLSDKKEAAKATVEEVHTKAHDLKDAATEKAGLVKAKVTGFLSQHKPGANKEE